jgi:branched-chain amino acid transport system ATP-binding protein
MAILQNSNVTKYFGNLAAVTDLSFEVENGEIFGIAGPNGAGKTTLFNLIAGIYSCSGKIYFNGQQINGLRPHRICKMGIARTFQVPLVFSSLTVCQNIETGAHFGYDGNEDKASLVSEILEIIGLQDKADIEAMHLRLFDKKLTMLGSALATRPKLLLLDEPASGLNPNEIAQSISLFKSINEKFDLTIIVIEHLMRVLMDISNRLMILNNGEMISIGPPSDVAKDKKVIEVYLGKEYVKS